MCMPNIKIYVDDSLLARQRPSLVAALGPIRDSLMRHLAVTHDACHLTIIPVLAPADQPAMNAEVQILQAPDRTRDGVARLGKEIQQILFDATGSSCAFRCMQHDPTTYVVLR